MKVNEKAKKGHSFDWQSKGRGFEPPQLHQKLQEVRSKGLTPLLFMCEKMCEKKFF